ncbi:MAG: T9SS type A sorting domain-containing protein [Gammaproteobacteria bacterium]|nr:T9SS type A sorting domain-containing protein [Gammaproteobacteria bacterium]NIW43609.1 T9SS type A sorting domain-containing protein [Gammaproteobacteria bacterium]NIX54733.1 T9SS type A sorting domain-containing protein [candidate division Zixibacteria bacterium]
MDKNGDTWIAADGTYGGVAKWVDDHWEVWETANAGVPLQGIQIIDADSLGNLWVGMKYLGLSIFDGNNWVHYDNSNSPLISNEIQCFYPEPGGPMWIGTYVGLFKYDNNNWTVYTESNSGLPANGIRGIDQDAQGNLWIATFEGLAKFDGANWTVYTESNSGIVSENVTDVEIDTNDVVWASGHNTQIWPYYGGVSRFDGSSWINFTPNNSPLPHLQVAKLDLDSRGNLWISAMSEAVAVYNPDGVVITGIEDIDDDILTDVPQNFRLDQNYPNPFNPTTTIRFALSKPGLVSLKVYDLTGRVVADLFNGYKNTGEYSIKFDGGQLASGMYFYRLQTERFSQTKQMLLIK